MSRARIAYSDEEMAWLKANRGMVISDYHAAFCERFGRTDITAAHLHGLRKRKGWKVGRDPSRYRGRHTKYSKVELVWLEANCTLPADQFHASFSKQFGRTDVTVVALVGLRKRKGWKTGRTGQFAKGAVSHNKGKRCAPGTGGLHPNSRKTQFKKGLVPHNHHGPGHESVDKDGYVWIVTDRRNPWTGASTWRVHKHRWLWERANGPIPKGHALKCLGEKSNCDPSNWELVPKALLPRLNGKSGRNYDRAPAELKPIIMAVAKVEHRTRELTHNLGGHQQ